MKQEESTEDLTAVCCITKVFGVRGEVKIQSYSRSYEEMKSLRDVWIGKEPASSVRQTIRDVVKRGAIICLAFENVNDCDAAESIIGSYVFVRTQDRKVLPSGSFFIDDVIGFAIFDSDGQLIGTLKDILKTPAHPVGTIETKNGEVLLPLVREMILSIDYMQKKIITAPPDGLYNRDTA